MGRGARERGPERVTAEEQAGARGGQARGVVEERVGSEEGEEHGGGGDGGCGSALVAGARGAGGLVARVGWGGEGPRAMATRGGRRGRGGEAWVRSAAQHVPPWDWSTSGLLRSGRVGEKD